MYKCLLGNLCVIIMAPHQLKSRSRSYNDSIFDYALQAKGGGVHVQYIATCRSTGITCTRRSTARTFAPTSANSSSFNTLVASCICDQPAVSFFMRNRNEMRSDDIIITIATPRSPPISPRLQGRNRD